MPLDPQVEAYLAQQAALGLPPISEQSPDQVRRRSEEVTALVAGPGEDVRTLDTRIAGVPVRLFEPHGAPASLPTLVYFHGGGWVAGNVRTHDRPCRALAHRAGCRVVSVDYRLAPEHPFPAAVEDAWAVTSALAAQAPRLAVGGDSAGGNLAAVMALRARDRKVPLRLQLLIYPVTDCDLERDSYRRYATGYGLTLDGMRWYWGHYMGKTPWSHPEASPLRAARLAGAAPALLFVCEYDPLRDEGLAYAERLQKEGVVVEVSELAGMIHGFFRMAAVIDRASAVYDRCAEALRRAFA